MSEQKEINHQNKKEITQQKQNHYLRKFYGGLESHGGSINRKDYKTRGFFFSNGKPDPYLNLLSLNGIVPKEIRKRADNTCLCGHYISEIHFIANIHQLDIWIQVGNCCVKRFKENKKRNCEDCHIPFSSGKNIRCPECRKKLSNQSEDPDTDSEEI